MSNKSEKQQERLPEVFADGVRQISFSSGVFRMELAGLGQAEGDQQNNPPPLVGKQLVMMPVDGFMQMFRSMKDIIDQLLAAGVLRSQEGGSPTASTNGSAQGDSGQIPAAHTKRISSNFD